MKKLLALLLCVALIAAFFAGCAGDPAEPDSTDASVATDAPVTPASDLKIGVVLVGDENEGYTYAHIMGVRAAVANCGLDEATNIVWKYNVKESSECKDAVVDCINQGCTLVLTNSYGHQSYAQEAAEENPDIQIVACTGDTAKASGLPNFHNAFTGIYQARYVAGIVAGMKVNELIADGKLTDKNYDGENVKIGYVGAFPYAEVISGFTSFFLGIKSVCPNVVMDVQYTGSWFDQVGEKEAAVALMDRGCCIIGQHADSTGAPTACEEAWAKGEVVYSVGYNVDMLAAAPNAALVSPTNEWGAFYTYAFKAVLEGTEFATNWCEGFETDAVALTPLGPNVAEGTQEAIDEAIEGIKAGEIHVFDINNFTVGGAKMESCFATDTDGDWTPDADEAVFDGYYHESYFQSAPAFATIIDGITPLN